MKFPAFSHGALCLMWNKLFCRDFSSTRWAIGVNLQNFKLQKWDQGIRNRTAFPMQRRTWSSLWSFDLEYCVCRVFDGLGRPCSWKKCFSMAVCTMFMVIKVFVSPVPLCPCARWILDHLDYGSRLIVGSTAILCYSLILVSEMSFKQLLQWAMPYRTIDEVVLPPFLLHVHVMQVVVAFPNATSLFLFAFPIRANIRAARRAVQSMTVAPMLVWSFESDLLLKVSRCLFFLGHAFSWFRECACSLSENWLFDASIFWPPCAESQMIFHLSVETSGLFSQSFSAKRASNKLVAYWIWNSRRILRFQIAFCWTNFGSMGVWIPFHEMAFALDPVAALCARLWSCSNALWWHSKRLMTTEVKARYEAHTESRRLNWELVSQSIGKQSLRSYSLDALLKWGRVGQSKSSLGLSNERSNLEFEGLSSFWVDFSLEQGKRAESWLARVLGDSC